MIDNVLVYVGAENLGDWSVDTLPYLLKQYTDTGVVITEDLSGDRVQVYYISDEQAKKMYTSPTPYTELMASLPARYEIY